VIYFPKWRVRFFYVEEKKRNVIRLWLDELDASISDRYALQSLIDICECSGPEALRAATIELGNGLFALLSKRKGGPELSPIFCHGPIGESEITFLAGAVLIEDELRPKYAVGVAEENLAVLKTYPERWRREPVT
jgi:hypothetical protein